MNLRERLKMSLAVRLLSNLKHYSKLRPNNQFYKEFGIRKKVWQSLSHDTIAKHSNDLPWLDGAITEQEIKTQEGFYSFSDSVRSQLLEWNRKGCMILPGFFDKAKIDKLTHTLTENLTPKQKQDYLSNRLLNIYKTNENVNAIFRDESLLKILSFILGKEIFPFQTINFHYSSSQPAHSDAIHLTTEPLGYSIGVWVALEDVTEGSGEFFFYPGSHRLQYILNKDFGRHDLVMPTPDILHKLYEKKLEEVIRESNLKQERFLAKKGDILIWHTNLIHGSLPKANSTATRKSLIMHYFAKGVLCYHEMLEKPAVLIDQNS